MTTFDVERSSMDKCGREKVLVIDINIFILVYAFQFSSIGHGQDPASCPHNSHLDYNGKSSNKNPITRI